MSIFCVLGIVLACLPLVAAFVCMACRDGIKFALEVFGMIIAAVVGVIAYLALVSYLLSHCS